MEKKIKQQGAAAEEFAAVNEQLEKYINENLISLIMSHGRDKEKIAKVKARPVFLKKQVMYQVSKFIGTKVFHENMTKRDFIAYCTRSMAEDFRQLEIHTEFDQITALVSKKGKITVKVKKKQMEEKSSGFFNGKQRGQAHGEQKAAEGDADKTGVSLHSLERLKHNREKKYILRENEPVEFLMDLGVQSKDGKIIRTKSDKFRQINRYLEFVRDILPVLPRDRQLTIIDFGCGKSYLTFALYYYLKVMHQLDIRIIGLDLKEDVIDYCNSLKDKYGYENLQFIKGDIGSFTGEEAVDMVVTLHACDVATDYALEKAVRWGASVIFAVPCCQHEIHKQIHSKELQPLLKYGLIKERMSALITDAIRANLLETQGYDAQILEFIDMEHTPKNILIRAVKKSETSKRIVYGKAGNSLKEMEEMLHITPSLERLLAKEEQ